MTKPEYHCALCGYRPDPAPAAEDLGEVRGNTARFKDRTFPLWRCPRCGTIHSLEPVDYADIYRDYPLNDKRRLDVFARGTLAHLMERIEKQGLKRDASILDYGCGNGILLEFLRGRGYTDVAGYDPYVPAFAERPGRPGGYDLVIANDVIEHVDDPRALLADALSLVRPGGLLYLGTADAAGVRDMHDLEPHIMRLHQPFHRVILTEEGLHRLGRELDLEEVASWLRSYMDTRRPFSNYRFLDEFSKALGHDMDRALDPAEGKIMVRHPSLFFWALFGYWFPSAMEPAVLWRRPA